MTVNVDIFKVSDDQHKIIQKQEMRLSFPQFFLARQRQNSRFSRKTAVLSLSNATLYDTFMPIKSANRSFEP